jgi:hypothetical protein
VVKNRTPHKRQGHHQADLLSNNHDKDLQNDHPKDLNGEPVIITTLKQKWVPFQQRCSSTSIQRRRIVTKVPQLPPSPHLHPAEKDHHQGSMTTTLANCISHNVPRRFLTTDAARRTISPSVMEARAIMCHLHNLNEEITTASPRRIPHHWGCQHRRIRKGLSPPLEKSSPPRTKRRCIVDAACLASLSRGHQICVLATKTDCHGVDPSPKMMGMSPTPCDPPNLLRQGGGIR